MIKVNLARGMQCNDIVLLLAWNVFFVYSPISHGWCKEVSILNQTGYTNCNINFVHAGHVKN